MNSTTNLIFIAVMVGAFWFLIMRPQQARQKQQREMLANLKAGDEIVTIGGVFGTVVSTGERLLVRTAGGAEFELAPQAVANVVPPKEDEDSVLGDADAESDAAVAVDISDAEPVAGETDADA